MWTAKTKSIYADPGIFCPGGLSFNRPAPVKEREENGYVSFLTMIRLSYAAPEVFTKMQTIDEISVNPPVSEPVFISHFLRHEY